MRASHAWAAGLFEGEGCFMLVPQRNPSLLHTKATLTSTDEDVVRRFHRVVGVGYIEKPRYASERSTKLSWRWRCNTLEGIEQLAEVIGPGLCKRRKARLEECLANDTRS